MFDNGFEAPGAERMVMTVTFDERAGPKTLLTLSTQFGSLRMRGEHVGMGFVQGSTSGLDQLGDFVATMHG